MTTVLNVCFKSVDFLIIVYISRQKYKLHA